MEPNPVVEPLIAERDQIVAILTDDSSASSMSELPDAPGLYALWPQSQRVIADLGLEDADGESPLADRALYLGKAEDSILDRVTATHFASRKTGHSTVRRTFAALLVLESQPRRSRLVAPTPKQFRTMTANFDLTDDDEERLTEWMVSNLTVRAATSQWMPLKDLERAVGAMIRPPLDQERKPMWSPNPWRDDVAMRRRRLQSQARAALGLDT